MPKYSDYREWESYREELLQAEALQRAKGIPTYGSIPLSPPDGFEGFTKWTENFYKNCPSE